MQCCTLLLSRPFWRFQNDVSYHVRLFCRKRTAAGLIFNDCVQLAYSGPRYSNDAATSWSRLPTDLLLQTFSLKGMADAPLLRAAIACRSWQHALGRSTQSLSFTWCSQQSLHQVRKACLASSITLVTGCTPSSLMTGSMHAGYLCCLINSQIDIASNCPLHTVLALVCSHTHRSGSSEHMQARLQACLPSDLHLL